MINCISENIALFEYDIFKEIFVKIFISLLCKNTIFSKKYPNLQLFILFTCLVNDASSWIMLIDVGDFPVYSQHYTGILLMDEP